MGRDCGGEIAVVVIVVDVVTPAVGGGEGGVFVRHDVAGKRARAKGDAFC